MLRKSTLLAVAASAALGLAMLAPTLPAPRGGTVAAHGGGGMHGGGGHGGGMHGRRSRSVTAATSVTSVIGIITRTGTFAITARSGTAFARWLHRLQHAHSSLPARAPA